MVMLFCLCTCGAFAQIPTSEERIRDSGLNRAILTWRAEQIRMHPGEFPLPEKVAGQPLRACLRYEFSLAAETRRAELAFVFSDDDILYVNGKVAAEPPACGRQGTLKVIDLSPFLRRGLNVLAFDGKADGRSGRIWLAEGIVFGKDGSVKRLLTEHHAWLGAWNLPGEWVSSGVPAGEMKPVPALRRDYKHPQPAQWPGSFRVVPPYLGRIQVSPGDMREPIFDEEAPVVLDLQTLNLRGAAATPAGIENTESPPPATVLAYTVMDERSRRDVDKGVVALRPQGHLDFAGLLEVGPLHQGAYRIRLTLDRDGKEIDRRDYEVAVVGKIEQRLVEGKDYEDGLALQETWSVDCTDEPAPGSFIAGIWGKSFKDESDWTDVATVVKEGPAGRYRTFAKHEGRVYFAYRYSVNRLYTPHLAVIEYPDDGRRSVMASVVEPTTSHPIRRSASGYQRGEAAIDFRGDPDPRHTNRMKKLHILFWPNEAEGSIHISNVPSGDKPAAAARMAVYEITNDLPALRVTQPSLPAGTDTGWEGRMIGPHSERGPQTVASTYYAGPLAMCDWGGRARMARHPEPLDWGYDDFTLGLFQEQTGIRVPVDAADPGRFGKRYDWLMSHARDAWVDWRARQYTELYRRLRDRLVQARPDLALRLVMSEPISAFVGPTPQGLRMDRDDLYHDPAGMQALTREFGVDLAALRKDPAIELARAYHVRPPQTDQGAHGGEYEMIRSSEFQKLFAPAGRSGVYCHVGLVHYGAFNYPPDKWLWRFVGTRQGYFWPRRLNNAFANLMARSSPNWIMHTWMDVADSTGRIHEMRTFARAYRSLPNGTYDRSMGNGLDRNIWIKTLQQQDVVYVCAVNTDWWEKQVTLRFEADAAPRDLLRDVPVDLDGGAWSFSLDPYGVQTFRMASAVNLVSADVEMPRVAVTESERAVAEADALIQQARSREAELETFPAWHLVEDLERERDAWRACLAAGDVSRAYRAATGWPSVLAQRRVRNECLEAIPFVILGPFGSLEDTDIEKWGTGNPEVVPDFRGMETAFIGESTDDDCERLVPGFMPDLSRRYAVYPFEGRSGRWEPRLKTYDLAFTPRSHSDPPYWMVAYAYTEVYSPVARTAFFWVGSEHALWAWVNDRRVLKYGGHGTHRGGQRGGGVNQNRATVHLNKGWNRVLLKAVQRGQARVHFRIGDLDRGGLDDLRYRVPRTGE